MGRASERRGAGEADAEPRAPGATPARTAPDVAVGRLAGGPVLPRERAAIPRNLDLGGRHRRIDPKVVPGRYLRWRGRVAWALVIFFVAAPHLRMQGKPLILLDVLHRHFTFFGATLRATDTQVLVFFLLTVFVGIFLVTALVGRAWCGWGCPQPIYLEFVFRPLERWIQGRGAARRTSRWRLAFKWVLYALISFALANTFLAYFVGREELLRWMSQPPWVHPVGFGIVALTTALMLFDFGWFREQMCTMACPYARLQSVLLDEASLVVGYDPRRGEPRGRSKPGPAPEGLGDCVDCGACVRACPTGIDIRDGLQLECIACTQCVDACDAIMDRMERPRGLVRYATVRELREGGRPRILRPRVLAYAVLFLALLGALVYSVESRRDFDVIVLRAQGAPFVLGEEGTVANVLRVKVTNRLDRERLFRVRLESPQEGIAFSVAGGSIRVPAGGMREANIVLTARSERFHGGRLPVELRVTPEDGSEEDAVLAPFVLVGPKRGGIQ